MKVFDQYHAFSVLSKIEQLYYFYKTPYTLNMVKGGFNKKNVVGTHVKTKRTSTNVLPKNLKNFFQFANFSRVSKYYKFEGESYIKFNY